MINTTIIKTVEVKIVIFFLIHQFKHWFWVLKKNRLMETVLLRTHNICFGWEIRKMIFKLRPFFKGLPYSSWKETVVGVWQEANPQQIPLTAILFQDRSSNPDYSTEQFIIYIPYSSGIETGAAVWQEWQIHNKSLRQQYSSRTDPITQQLLYTYLTPPE